MVDFHHKLTWFLIDLIHFQLHIHQKYGEMFMFFNLSLPAFVLFLFLSSLLKSQKYTLIIKNKIEKMKNRRKNSIDWLSPPWQQPIFRLLWVFLQSNNKIHWNFPLRCIFIIRTFHSIFLFVALLHCTQIFCTIHYFEIPTLFCTIFDMIFFFWFCILLLVCCFAPRAQDNVNATFVK